MPDNAAAHIAQETEMWFSAMRIKKLDLPSNPPEFKSLRKSMGIANTEGGSLQTKEIFLKLV